jgi:anti-sigma28 factor (negative regulator of flagellin synthesis)
VLEIYRWILKSEPHDVRWEKVERVKRILTGGTYLVPPKQVAAKLIEQMLERGRGNQGRERS